MGKSNWFIRGRSVQDQEWAAMREWYETQELSDLFAFFDHIKDDEPEEFAKYLRHNLDAARIVQNMAMLAMCEAAIRSQLAIEDAKNVNPGGGEAAK